MSVPAFAFRALPWNVVFGPGRIAQVAQVVERVGGRRALLLCTPGQRGHAERIATLLGPAAAGIFDSAVMHVPAATVAAAKAVVASTGADTAISIGGGSTTGLAKILKLHDGIRHVAVATTYAGSEMTNIWAITDGDRKTTGRDERAVPSAVIYDPELTLGLPARVAGHSGFNALAQCVVNVCSGVANPIGDLFAIEAIGVIARGLPRVVAQPGDLDARTEMLYGACLAGAVVGMGTAGLHHRLCHTLGGTWQTPHAETHAILLPHSVAHNAPAVPAQTRRVAAALGADDAARAIHELALAIGNHTALRDIGFPPQDIDRAVAITLELPFPNPQPVTPASLRHLLENATLGRPPSVPPG